jgi:hypothetical protein
MQDSLGHLIRHLHYVMIVLLQEGAKTANNYPSGNQLAKDDLYFDR